MGEALHCPVCKAAPPGTEDAEDGDIFTCPSCGRVFVVRDFGKFKSLRFPDEEENDKEPTISI